MQAQGRRKGSAATESEARSTSTPRNPTPSRSQSANRRAAAFAGGSGNTENASARSGSQPKQRGKSSNNNTSSSAGDKTVATQTPFEAALARVKKLAAGKTDEQLELLLQQLLQQRQFEDAAYLIASAPSLEAKYKTSDVIRLLLDAKQFDKAAQLMRDLKLHHTDQPLVTLFINELVRTSLFQAAVRYAQEMVHHFGKPVDPLNPTQARPSWTPQALVQAMIRAQQYRSALKYAKQFDLLDMFPPAQLIASLFEVRRWDEAVSSVLEFRLFQDFPLELLVAKLLENRQWSNAVKCINKLPSPDMIEKANEALVREASRVGDFVTAIRYLREFKLDQPNTHGALLKYCVDCMVAHGEFYKAIKYSIKFGLHVPPPDAEETGERSVYDTEVLIRQAIATGQFHVALLYIKKLKLQDRFTAELSLIQQQQARMAQEFQQFMAARAMQCQQPHVQSEMAAILKELAVDEKVDQVVEVEIVVSVEEEIFPRKPRKPMDQEDVAVGQPLTEDSGAEAPFEPPRKSSRFSFARDESGSAVTGESAPPAPSSLPQSQPVPEQMPRAPPPGLVSASMATPSTISPVPEPASSSSFDFAQFAANLHSGPSSSSSGPHPPPPQPLPPQGMGHLFPHQASSQQPNAPRSTGFYPPPPPPPFSAPPNQHGFSGPPPPAPQQQPPPMYYQSPSQPGFSHPPPPPPPPMPPHYLGQNGGASNGSFDVSSLAMQFHARPQGPSFGNNGYGNHFVQGAPPPPPMPPGMPGGLFPTMGPGPGPMQQPFPPQPQFSFKPTVSYTSVTTTRQKKQ